jgi:DsbC/DsbD-like thiol-disulfide interchange protein/cytochrome c biogenesis protein CcdA
MTLLRALFLILMPSQAVPAKGKWGWAWPQLGKLCLAVLVLFAGTSTHAQIPGAPQNVRASIEAETITPAPGDTVTIAIVMDPKPGWHDYWLNPGDAGTPLELEWKLPPGVTAGPIRAPVPETLIIGGFMNHVYQHKHGFLVDLTIAPDLRKGQRLDIAVNARWSACSDEICVPEGGILSVPLTVGSGNIAQSERARFDRWRAALPVPLDRQARYDVDGRQISVAIPYPQSAALDNVWFFAQTENIFRYAAMQSARRTGDWLIITGEIDKSFDGRIDGLLRFGKGEGLEVRALPGMVPTGGDMVSVLGSTATPENLQSTINFGWILGFSVLGGLLLNLMPCVFPILGLKALSLARLGGDGGEGRRDALAYSTGVIVSCLALGGLLLALRAGGEEIGWAFQLQEPAFVLLLLLLMVAVTANLAGLFEIGSINAGDALTRAGGMAGSFWTGVLAAVVATPCTGPFMAAALGAALLLPVAQALLLFAGLGLGLALPFLLLAFVPATRRILPRPGPWLNMFRKAMAVPMGLTALALLWLLWRLAGGGALLVAILAVIAVIAGLWLAGHRQQTRRAVGAPVFVLLGLILFGGSSFAIDRLPTPEAEETAAGDLLRSEPFTEQRLASYRENGANVLVYFTADWCVTCKINEATALHREQTKQAFAAKRIKVLKGDFTRRDPVISRFLEQHGRSGVPLYLYYPAGGEPVILPQILTVDILVGLGR